MENGKNEEVDKILTVAKFATIEKEELDNFSCCKFCNNSKRRKLGNNS